MNLTRQRNPHVLLHKLGLSAPVLYRHTLLQQEEALYASLARHTELVAPMMLVMGGFCDHRHGRAYAICQAWAASCASHFAHVHVYYREHMEGESARKLVALYVGKGVPVVLAGHSWGGDAVANAVAHRLAAPVDLLVTLDPVSRKAAPCELAQVRHWLNVYVDYTCAAWLNLPNLVARIGGPWQCAAAAHENIVAPQLGHEDALAMFQRHALKQVCSVLQGRGPL